MARHLRERYGDGLRSYSAMGYHEAFAVLDGRWDRETAITEIALRTRRYAKRQATWFRHQELVAPPVTHRINARIAGLTQFSERNHPQIFAFLQSGG